MSKPTFDKFRLRELQDRSIFFAEMSLDPTIRYPFSLMFAIEFLKIVTSDEYIELDLLVYG